MCCYGEGDYSIRMLFWGLEVRKGQQNLYDCLWLFNVRSIQMHFSTDSIYATKLILQFFVLCVKILPIFNVSVWLHDEFNLKWTATRCLDQSASDVLHSFHVLQLQSLYLCFADISRYGLQQSIYTDSFTADPEYIQPLLPSFASNSLARLVTLETPVCLIEYPFRIIFVYTAWCRKE